MFPKKARFSFKGSLPNKIFNSSSFNVRYEKNSAGLKVAVVVSKKVDRRANVRNKIKRQILNMLKKEISELVNLNLVFYVKKQAIESSSLEKEISELINKIK